jgi:hypothetical protein
VLANLLFFSTVFIPAARRDFSSSLGVPPAA